MVAIIIQIYYGYVLFKLMAEQDQKKIVTQNSEKLWTSKGFLMQSINLVSKKKLSF